MHPVERVRFEGWRGSAGGSLSDGVYYSAQILFLGAEFTKVSIRDRGRNIRPADDAVRIVKRELKIA